MDSIDQEFVMHHKRKGGEVGERRIVFAVCDLR